MAALKITNPEDIDRYVSGSVKPCIILWGGAAVKFRDDFSWAVCARDGKGLSKYGITGVVYLNREVPVNG